MRSVSDAAAFPRDARTWPRGAFAVSLVCGLASLAGSAALVASASSLGRAAWLMVVFVVLAWLEGLVYVDALRPWLRGNPVAPRTWLMQLAVALLALAAFAGGPATAGAAILGILAGVLLPTASTIQYSRIVRALVDEEDVRLAQELTASRPHAEDPPMLARRAPQVGAVLRERVAKDRARSLAWAAATGVVAVGGVAMGIPAPVLLGVVLLGTAALVWVSRRLLRVWSALRDFESAATEPRAAYVLLLKDPSTRASRPLLGVWSKEPVPVGGRLPPAEVAYRCDAKHDALISTQGAAAVHEAWVETGPGPRSRPRWVVADAGVVLPQRRAVLGARYLTSIVGTERPGRARPLTMPVPHPSTETVTGTAARVVTETACGSEELLRLFAWRLAGLVLAGVVFAWLS
jgi:hypothetical protein